MDTDTSPDGVPCWAELDTPAPEAAADFCSQLFGWQVRDGACLLDGRPVAAIRPAPAASRGTWTMHVAVADAAATASRVTAAGGAVASGPGRSRAAGRSAELADHSGTTFAVRQAAADVPGGEPGTFARGELITDDVEASAAFYGTVFGWKLSGPEGPLGRREWQLDGRTVSGLLPRPPAMPADTPPYWDVYFTVTVTDPAATARAAARLGGAVLMPATVTGHATIAVFTDPAGAVFSVMTTAH